MEQSNRDNTCKPHANLSECCNATNMLRQLVVVYLHHGVKLGFCCCVYSVDGNSVVDNCIVVHLRPTSHKTVCVHHASRRASVTPTHGVSVFAVLGCCTMSQNVKLLLLSGVHCALAAVGRGKGVSLAVAVPPFAAVKVLVEVWKGGRQLFTTHTIHHPLTLPSDTRISVDTSNIMIAKLGVRLCQ